MEKEQIDSEKMCSVCDVEAVSIDNMCQFCYEESIEEGFQEKPKEVMPKHGQGLKTNPSLQKERLIKKSIKIQRRR